MNKEAFEKALDGRFSRLGAPDDMVGELVDWFEEYCRDKGVELFEEKQVITAKVNYDLIEYYKRWKL